MGSRPRVRVHSGAGRNYEVKFWAIQRWQSGEMLSVRVMVDSSITPIPNPSAIATSRRSSPPIPSNFRLFCK